MIVPKHVDKRYSASSASEAFSSARERYGDWIIAVPVVGGVVVVGLILTLLCCCLKKRRQRAAASKGIPLTSSYHSNYSGNTSLLPPPPASYTNRHAQLSTTAPSWQGGPAAYGQSNLVQQPMGGGHDARAHYIPHSRVPQVQQTAAVGPLRHVSASSAHTARRESQRPIPTSPVATPTSPVIANNTDDQAQEHARSDNRRRSLFHRSRHSSNPPSTSSDAPQEEPIPQVTPYRTRRGQNPFAQTGIDGSDTATIAATEASQQVEQAGLLGEGSQMVETGSLEGRRASQSARRVGSQSHRIPRKAVEEYTAAEPAPPAYSEAVRG